MRLGGGVSLDGGLSLRVNLSPGLHLRLLRRRLALHVFGGLALDYSLLRCLALRLGGRMGLGGDLTFRLDLSPTLSLRLLRRRLTLAVFGGLALDSGLLDRLSLRQGCSVGQGGRLTLGLDLRPGLHLSLLGGRLPLAVLGRLMLERSLLSRLTLRQGGGVGLVGRLALHLQRALPRRLGLLLGGLLNLNGLLLGVRLEGVLSRERGDSRACDSSGF